MPRQRVLESYPTPIYWALCNRVLGTREPFLTPCTPAAAASLRGELYAWRRACEHNPDEAALLGVDVKQLRALLWRIQVEPAGLLTCLAAHQPGPNLVAQALGLNPEAAPSPAEAALQRLRGMVESDNGG